MKKGFIALISLVSGVFVGCIGVGKTMGKRVQQKQGMSEKHLALFLLMNQWVKMKQEGKDMGDYLKKRGYGKIAIYGMSYVGERLYEELEETDIAIAYAVDEKADEIYAQIDVVTPDDDLPDVDALIVTPICFFDEIEQSLKGKIKADIISLEDILYDL